MNDDDEKTEDQSESTSGEERDHEAKEFSVEEIENDPAYNPDDEKFEGIKGA